MRPCTHGMPTPSACVDCMDEGNIAPPPRPPALAPETGRSFTARFDGQCPGCNLPTRPGDWIVKMNDGTYQHAHHWRA